MAEEKEQVSFVIIAGHFGYGKSIICNTIVGKPTFKSGLITDGVSVTKEDKFEQFINKKGNLEYVIDTVGLDKLNPLEGIKLALKFVKIENGKLKFNIVIRMCNGHVYPGDNNVVRNISNIIDCPFEINIIVNLVQPVLFDHIMNNKSETITMIKKKFGEKVKHILFIEQYEDIYQKENTLLPCRDEILSFIDKQTAFPITKLKIS